jgi:hypothetical protein
MMSSLHDDINGGSYSDATSSSSSASGDSINCSTNDVAAKTATSAAEEETCSISIKHKRRREKKKKKKQSNKKSQHSLDHLRQRVSHLMNIFEEKGWFIPMPDLSNKSSISHNDQQNTKKNSGKVWSNRNYGADKKRQRKASERFILESRILQLETVLKDDYGVMNP